MDRTKFIGGSDAAGVLGLSRWDTPLSVWAEKTGQYIKPEVESEAAELGKELEDYVARRFERKADKKVERADGPRFHALHPFLGANVDRLIPLENAGLECKTASAWKSKEWKGEEIPQEYIIQCYHYMMVTGLKKWYLAVLIGNQHFKIKELFWDDQLIGDMRKREVQFWNEFVIPKTMPMHVSYHDTDVLLGLFPQAADGKITELNDEANILIENITSYKQDARNLEQQIEQNENQLKAMLGDAEQGQTSIYKVMWSNMNISRFDLKAFEEKNPELAKQFRIEKLNRRFCYKPLNNNGEIK